MKEDSLFNTNKLMYIVDTSKVRNPSNYMHINLEVESFPYFYVFSKIGNAIKDSKVELFTSSRVRNQPNMNVLYKQNKCKQAICFRHNSSASIIRST